MFRMMKSEVVAPILEQNPDQPVELLVRNFNTPTIGGEYSPTVGMRIHSLKIDFNNVDLKEILPAQLVDDMISASDWGGRITAKIFIDYGLKIAAAMGRAVTIVHQQGGNQEEADYTTYGPFLPE